MFYGCKSKHMDAYGIKTKGDFPKVYEKFLVEQGAPSALRRDNANEEQSEAVDAIHRRLIIKDQFSEPHNQQQNPVEWGCIRWLVFATHALLDQVGAPDSLWFLASQMSV